VGSEKPTDVIRLDGRKLYCRVETSGTASCRADVPERDTVFSEHAKTFFIRTVRERPDKFAHDPPEGIVWLSIILTALQRDFAGKGAQDEHASIGASHAFETARFHDVFCCALPGTNFFQCREEKIHPRGTKTTEKGTSDYAGRGFLRLLSVTSVPLW
jgi:hypothetical protein